MFWTPILLYGAVSSTISSIASIQIMRRIYKESTSLLEKKLLDPEISPELKNRIEKRLEVSKKNYSSRLKLAAGFSAGLGPIILPIDSINRVASLFKKPSGKQSIKDVLVIDKVEAALGTLQTSFGNFEEMTKIDHVKLFKKESVEMVYDKDTDFENVIFKPWSAPNPVDFGLSSARTDNSERIAVRNKKE